MQCVFYLISTRTWDKELLLRESFLPPGSHSCTQTTHSGLPPTSWVPRKMKTDRPILFSILNLWQFSLQELISSWPLFSTGDYITINYAHPWSWRLPDKDCRLEGPGRLPGQAHWALPWCQQQHEMITVQALFLIGKAQTCLLAEVNYKTYLEQNEHASEIQAFL